MTGLGLVQLAYRDGGLGAPLATPNLVDPLVAVVLGVTVLGEPFPPALARIGLVAVGLIATSSGIGMLTLPPGPAGCCCGSAGAPKRASCWVPRSEPVRS